MNDQNQLKSTPEANIALISMNDYFVTGIPELDTHCAQYNGLIAKTEMDEVICKVASQDFNCVAHARAAKDIHDQAGQE